MRPLDDDNVLDEALAALQDPHRLTDADRSTFIDECRERFCLHCGSLRTPGDRMCQCENDE